MACNTIKFKAYSENQWIFSDDLVTDFDSSILKLDVARNGCVMLQLLTDEKVKAGDEFSLSVCGANGVTIAPYQLVCVHVGKNSGPDGKPGLAECYDDVKDFVTKKAPFDVYEALAPLDDKIRRDERLALALTFTASKEAKPSNENIKIAININNKSLCLEVSLNIHKATIPDMRDSELTVVNWFAPLHIAQQFGIEPYGDEYYEKYEKLLPIMKDIRNNHFSIQTWKDEPVHEKIRNEKGEIIDFDLSRLERHLQLAEKAGMTKLYGEYFARFLKWNEKEIFLIWDWEKQVDITSFEAYKQIKAYFTRVVEMVERNNWQDKYVQTIVDEPQFANAEAYRILCGMIRQFYPGIIIHDPVETYTIPASADILCVKQAIYEQYIDEFKKMQDEGIRMTYYTCGYPAGRMMNRVIDLPLFVGRLCFWMCHKYNFEGFLHWGFNCACDFDETVLKTMPAGNQHIVYGVDGEYWPTVRSHNQRAGAEDWELLSIIKKKKPELVKGFLNRGCRTFSDYETDVKKIEQIRLDILNEADKCY